MKKVIRLNQLDNLFACTPGVVNPDGFVRIRREDKDGQTARDMICQQLAGVKVEVKAWCETRQVNEERVAEMFVYGMGAWGDLAGTFKNSPMFDRHMNADVDDDTILSGKIGVVSPIGNTSAIFAEFHFGDIGDGYQQKMAGMAWALWCKLGRPDDDIRGVAVFLRHRYTRVMRWRASELANWELEFKAKLSADLSTNYKPGRQCVSCAIAPVCRARKALVEQLTERFLGHGTGARYLAGATAETKDTPEVRGVLDDLTTLVKLTQADLDAAKDLIRETVERLGPVQLDSGLSLVVRRIDQKTVDPVKAWRPLRSHLPDADILAASRMSLLRLLAAKAASYGRGEKQAARDTLESDLTKAGAVTVTTIHRLEEADLQPEVSDDSCGTSLPSGPTAEGIVPRPHAGDREQPVDTGSGDHQATPDKPERTDRASAGA